MKPATNRPRGPAVLLAAVLGAALALQPTAPAAAAPAQAELAPAASFSNATATVTASRVPSGIDDAGVQAIIIICRISVANPHNSSHVPGRVNVVATVTCTLPVSGIAAIVALYRDGDEQVSVDADAKPLVRTLKVNTSTPCVPGIYAGAGVARVFFPPGFTPRVGEIADISNVVLIAC